MLHHSDSPDERNVRLPEKRGQCDPTNLADDPKRSDRTARTERCEAKQGIATYAQCEYQRAVVRHQREIE